MNILLAIYKDLTYRIYHIRPTDVLEDAVKTVRCKAVCYKLLDSKGLPPIFYQGCLKINPDFSFSLDRQKVEEGKLNEVRDLRQNLFNKLNYLNLTNRGEENNEKIEFLKGITDYFDFSKFNTEELIKLDFFNNIWKIVVSDGGSDYDFVPKIEISRPENGVTAKAIPIMEQDKVKEIKVIFRGSGYKKIPSIEIESPKEGKTAKAFAILENITL